MEKDVGQLISDTVVSVELTMGQLDTILQVLGDAPFIKVNGVIPAIYSQGTEHYARLAEMYSKEEGAE